MDIKHSRRILILGAPDSGALGVIEKLTGSSPQPHSTGSTAGLTHEWNAETQYYTAKVPIWVDEIAQTEEWKAEFLKPEAKEVVEAVGAWIYVFRAPHDAEGKQQVEAGMNAIFEVSEAHLEERAQSLMLAVSVPTPRVGSGLESEEWEDVCLNYGFEYVDFSAKGINEFGEKVGFERLKEALESNEWQDSGGSDDADLEELLLNDEEGSDGFARDEAEMTAEIFGVKAALAREDDDGDGDEFEGFGEGRRQENQVEDLDRLMGKLMAVKESSAGLPEAERRRLAAKAVSEVMKESAL